MRSRRSCLVLPGSSDRRIEESRELEVDYVLLDLQDAVAPPARSAVADAVAAGGWRATTVAVRVHDLSTAYTYRDVIEVVETAGPALDVLVLPKVQTPDQVVWLDLLLCQIERTMGFSEGGIGIEAMIETASGLLNAAAIARASPRVQALVFGPDGYADDAGMPSPFAGSSTFPGSFDAALSIVRAAATAAGVQAIDGPSQNMSDLEGLRARASRSAGLGFDGMWVLHPDQIAVAAEAFPRTSAAVSVPAAMGTDQ